MLSSLLNKGMFLLTTTNNVIIPEVDSGLNVTDVTVVPSALVMIVSGILAVACIGIIAIILLQKKRASGIGAALAGTGETYWSKNKGKSAEGSLERLTKLGGAVLIIGSLILNVLIK